MCNHLSDWNLLWAMMSSPVCLMAVGLSILCVVMKRMLVATRRHEGDLNELDHTLALVPLLLMLYGGVFAMTYFC